VRGPIGILLASACVAWSLAAGAQAPGQISLAGETLAAGIPLVGTARDQRAVCGLNAADRRVYLFADNEPLADIAAHLKRLIPRAPGKGLWFKSGSTWVFDEDIASRNARRAAGARRLRESAAERQRRYDDLRRWTREDGGATGINNKRTSTGRFMTVFDGLPANKRKAAFQGRWVRAGYGDLTSAGQQALRRLSGPAARGNDGAYWLRRQADLDRMVIEIWPTGTPKDPALTMSLRRGPGLSGAYMPDLLNPPKWDPKEGSDYSEIHKQYRDRNRGPAKAEDIPALQRKINLAAATDKHIEDVLAVLHQESGLPLLGEYDPCLGNLPSPEFGRKALNGSFEEPLPLYQALALVAKRFDLDWDYYRGWIHIRSPRTLLAWAGEVDLSPPANRSDQEAPH